MSSPIVNCPLCFQPAFSSLTALSMSLINVASRSLDCPVCQECLPGLDKFTIHIFGHALNHQISHKTQHNGVLKVVASNSGHNVMPIDIPVYIEQIDDSANNSFLEKAASDFKDSRLFSPNNDDNNYNVIESKSSGNKMYKTTQKCENNNVESIINNNDRQSSINCGNTMYKTALEYENNNVESITTNNSNSHISINCESNNLKSIITDHNSQISIKYDGNVLIYNPTLRCSDDDNKDKYSNNKIKTIGSNDDGITITLENVDNTEKGCYTSIKSNDSLTCVTSDNNTTISDDNLGYSQDNSNDLIKNLEPYIKYGVDNFKKNSNQSFVERSLNDEGSSMGCVENTSNLVQTSEIYGTENFNEKNSSQRFVERISNDGASATDCGMDQEMSCMVQNSSNLLQTCKNDTSFSNLTGMRCLDVGETSNKVISSDQKLVQTCKNDQSFSKLTAMQCLDVDEISNKVVNPCRNDSDDGNNSYEPVFSKSLESFGECNTLASENINVDKQYEVVVPLVFEAESICGLKNDGMKTKSSKKYVKRKFRKKSLDSTMTTQGVQTMEESFTKNNNPFGKFSTIDKRCEDFVQELNMEGNNLVSGSVSGTNIDAVAVRSASIVTDTIRSANMDSVAIICANSNSVENENSTFCELCLFSFPDRNILQMHKNLVHGDCDGELKKTFSCHLCSKSFNMRGSLMVHRRVAHPVLSGGQVSLRNIERIKEMKASTSNDEASPQFSCKTCEKSFKKEQHLTQHERTHEVKQWECDICSKVFSTKYFLKKHKRLHTGEMPYTCAMCGKSFTFQQSYHKHLLYHSDEKPHVCCQCGRAFKELSTLHNHQRIHTGEKPFACETCGKCFRQRVSYLVHRRIHTGVMPYKCTICNKSFRYKVSERTHKCNNATPGHVVDKMNDVVEKLQKMEEINTKSKQDLSVSISCASGSSHASNLETASCREETHLDDLQQENQCVNPTLSGAQPNKLSCEKIVESIQEFWTDISKPSTSSGQREASSDENIFSAESSDFLSFVLTPSFSPSEQFQNLTLSPDSAQNRGRGIENTEGDTISNSDRFGGNFETINEQSLKELLDNVDVL